LIWPADDRGPGTARELDGERADPAGCSGDDDGLALLGLDGVYRPPRGRPRDEQGAGHLPGDLLRLAGEVAGLDEDQLGLGGPLVREPDHLVAGGESAGSGADLLDDPGEVAALPGRERRREQLRHRPRRMTASLGLMPVAFTRTRTCPSPGTGRSTSSTRNTSIPPNSSYLTAFTMTSLL
jgi:hypothetical protein